MVSDKKHIILYNSLPGCMQTVHSIGVDFIEDASETHATPIKNEPNSVVMSNYAISMYDLKIKNAELRGHV